MTRAGEEMLLELANILDKDVVKTAAKKDDEDEKKEEKEEKEEKEDEKEEKEENEEKKSKGSVMVKVLQDLVKLASELDDIGATDASELVDDALKVIVDNLEK